MSRHPEVAASGLEGSKGSTFARREHARHRARKVRNIVEERVRPMKPARPPAEHFRCAAGEDSQRRRRRRAGRERPEGGAFVDAAQRRAQRFVAGMAAGFAVHERMNESDDGEARTGGGIGDRRTATIGVPAQDLAGEPDTTQGVGTRGQGHPARRHLEDVGAAGDIEHIRPIEKPRERLTVRAVADEAEAGGRRNLARHPAHMAAPAAEGKVDGHTALNSTVTENVLRLSM